MEMAEFCNSRYLHARSTSTPSSHHPKAEKVAENLKKLNEWNSSLSSLSFSNFELSMFSDGFRCLKEFLDSVHDLIQLGSTQQSLLHSRIIERSTLEETLDGSLRLLDLCNSVKYAMSHMKCHLRDLQSALRRRRCENSDIENKISAYFNSKKQMKKEIKHGLTAIKRAEEQRKSSAGLFPGEDDQLDLVISVLREARLITISILDSLLMVISVSRITKRAKQFPIFQRWMGKGRVSWFGQRENANEVKKVDDSLSGLCSKLEYGKHLEPEQQREIQNQIEVLGESIQSLEDGLEGAFRRLIQSRAGLLNFLYH